MMIFLLPLFEIQVEYWYSLESTKLEGISYLLLRTSLHALVGDGVNANVTKAARNPPRREADGSRRFRRCLKTRQEVQAAPYCDTSDSPVHEI